MDFSLIKLENQAHFVNTLLKDQVIDKSYASLIILKKKKLYQFTKRNNIIPEFLLELIGFEVSFTRELKEKCKILLHII